MRRAAFLVVAALSLGLLTPVIAGATQFKGAVAYWGPILVNVAGNRVTSITGHTGALTCASGTSVGPVEMALARPVSIHQGRFQASGVGKTEGWKTPTSWDLTGSVSIHRTISGTVSATAQLPTGEICKGTFPFEAVVAPRAAESPRTSMYQTREPSAAQVRFDYRHGVITHLVVVAPVICPDTSDFTAELDSVSYSLDPIQVNRDRFRLAADVLDDYGVVMHISMTGTIKGREARGAISASRGEDIRGHVQKCAMHGSWASEMPAAAPTPPPAPTSGAFYDVTPYRYGSTGGWTYYLMVQPTSCDGGIVAIRFSVAGGTKTVWCGSSAKLGPLTPQRNYHLDAVAVRRNGSGVPLAASNVYIPGDDGNWVPVK